MSRGGPPGPPRVLYGVYRGRLLPDSTFDQLAPAFRLSRGVIFSHVSTTNPPSALQTRQPCGSRRFAANSSSALGTVKLTLTAKLPPPMRG